VFVLDCDFLYFFRRRELYTRVYILYCPRSQLLRPKKSTQKTKTIISKTFLQLFQSKHSQCTHSLAIRATGYTYGIYVKQAHDMTKRAPSSSSRLPGTDNQLRSTRRQYKVKSDTARVQLLLTRNLFLSAECNVITSSWYSFRVLGFG
jgi:hypothetical protein